MTVLYTLYLYIVADNYYYLNKLKYQYLLCWYMYNSPMPANTYYAQNYASIMWTSLETPARPLRKPKSASGCPDINYISRCGMIISAPDILASSYTVVLKLWVVKALGWSSRLLASLCCARCCAAALLSPFRPMPRRTTHSHFANLLVARQVQELIVTATILLPFNATRVTRPSWTSTLKDRWLAGWPLGSQPQPTWWVNCARPYRYFI